MGYRSEVVLAVDKKLMPEFLAHLATSDEAKTMVFADHDHLDQDYCDEGHLLVTWNGIKWYESYPEVNVIEKFISEMDEDEDKSEMFKFVRIGEDYDDVEDRGYGFDIHVNRSIDY